MVSSWSRHQTVGAETQCQGGWNLGRSKYVRASCWWHLPPPPPVKRRWMRCELDLCLHFNGSAQAGFYYCPFFMMSLWRESWPCATVSWGGRGERLAGGWGGGRRGRGWGWGAEKENKEPVFPFSFLMWSHTCSHIVPLWVCARGGVVLLVVGVVGAEGCWRGQGVLIVRAFDEEGGEWIGRGLCSSEGVVKVHVSGQVKEGPSLCLTSPRWWSKTLISVPSTVPTHCCKNSPCCQQDLCRELEIMATGEWLRKWLNAICETVPDIALPVSQVVMDQLNPGLKNLVNLGKSYEKSVTGNCRFINYSYDALGKALSKLLL